VADPLHVELVAADRVVWSGDATSVIARTTEGDIGILPGHQPLLAVLTEGAVEVQTVESECWVAAVDAGFLSVADDRVSILADEATMAHDIDLEQARRDLEQARSAGSDDAAAADHVRKAEARVRAAERAG
jgi:F-type H+-transporting ATPase subunit epsilon